MSVVVSHQGNLIEAIYKLFPSQQITQNARKNAALVNDTGRFAEIDIYLPHLNLGFEFQDAYHYVPIWYVNVNLDLIKFNDSKKECMARNVGTTLIYVPCWWDNDLESLVATIEFQRPDLAHLLPQQTLHSHPISLNPPPSFFISEAIPDIGQVMLASFVTSDSSFGQSLFIDRFWWIGEKYDGIHCVWHPAHRQLYARRGGSLAIDDRLIRSLTTGITSFIEGEIWNGRGMFLESQRIRNQSSIQDLPYTRVVTFDDPSPRLHSRPFERRYRHMLSSIIYGHPTAITAFRMKSITRKLAQNMLKDVIEGGGEGLMLRKPKSIYEPGRSVSLLKLKATQGDTEALVVSVQGNTLTLRLPSGVVFDVRQSFTPDNQPKKGDVVTFEFDHLLRREAPVNPVVTRIREDIRWDDVLSDYLNSTPQVSSNKDGKLGYVSKPPRFWTREGYKNLRLFLENFARERNMDPLLASSWYSTPGNLLQHSEVYNAINRRGGYIKTLVDLFPEIEFDLQQFSNVQKGHWMNIANRRRFFDGLANDQGFDPLIADNWYNIPASVILEKDANFFIIKYYNGNFHNALIHVYPDIGLQSSSFNTQPRIVLDSQQMRRKVFEDFAKENQFDPLIAENWYNVDEKSLRSRKNAGLVLSHYGQSVARALMDIFPNIGLRIENFNMVPRGYWTRFKNRKKFFDEFAKKQGFDPLVASNWHQQTANEFLTRKNAHAVLYHYNGSFKRALDAIYPNIGLNFEFYEKGHWSKEQEQKIFFDDYAKENNFDPLVAENWYNVSHYAIVTKKHGLAILAKHQSIKKALMTIYPNIGLKVDKFKYVGYLKHKSNKKKFFDHIAAENAFDPTNLSNWHKFGEPQIMQYPGVKHVTRPYGWNLWRALEDIYS